MNERQIKIGEQIRRQLSFDLLLLDLRGITIMNVIPTADLRMCKVYFRTVYDNINKIQDILSENSDRISNILFKKLNLKNRIKLKFFLDDTQNIASEINDLIEKLDLKDDGANDRI